MKVAVIGAGPAGLTAAYLLSKGGVEVDVYETSANVGGMSRSIKLWNQTVDLGPHRFFSNNKRVNDFWLAIAEKDYVVVDRMTRIFYQKKLFYYPLKPFDALSKLGFFEASRCVLSYLYCSLIPNNSSADTFETWVVKRFGRRLFSIFFKTYSEKLWGLSCSELDADFARQRIQKLNLFTAVWNALTAGRGNKLKTLVDQFLYPKYGNGMIYEKLAEKISTYGSKIFLNQKIENLKVIDDHSVELLFRNGERKTYDRVISTMPLTNLVSALGSVPLAIKLAITNLCYRNTILVYLEIKGNELLFKDNWLYIHQHDLQCGRITNFGNWSKYTRENSNNTILCLEFWCNDTDALWTENNDNLSYLAKKELCATGLIGQREILNSYVYKVNKCYPVYKSGYRQHLEQIVNYLRPLKNVIPIGRYGSFKYNNQDHSIFMGILAYENIVHNTNHDLWSVNSDDEYQEAATLDEKALSTNALASV